ncbi:MAG TPA: hypothetical protein VMT76_15615 [Puia sp.]|nr:hypothetical protein [Puia sp.]
MAYIVQHAETGYEYHLAKKKPSPISRFFLWAEKQDEKNHILWVGGSVTAMAAVIFPLTMAAVLVNGGGFGLIIGAMTSLVLVVITNLAAMPTKYTVPFFFLGILIDAAVIAASFFI